MTNACPDREIRKAKVLAFIEKDMFVLNNYESVPYKNRNHALECLIPYHIFHLTADDIKFRGSDVEIDMRKEIEQMKSKIKNMFEEISFENDGFTPQLLLYHQQKYLNSKIEMVKPAPISPQKKKRNHIDQKYLRFRIPRTEIFDVSGPIFKMRIRRYQG